MVRELTMAGRPEPGAVGGALLAPTIPSVERIDEPTEDGQGVRAEAIVPKGDLPALPSDMETEHIEIPAIESGVYHARSQHEAVAAAETQAGLFKYEILHHVSLEAMEPQSPLAFLNQRVEFRPVLLGNEDGIAAHARRPDVEPVDGTDCRDTQRREELEKVRTKIGRPRDQHQDGRTDADAQSFGQTLWAITEIGAECAHGQIKKKRPKASINAFGRLSKYAALSTCRSGEGCPSA